MPEDRRLAAIMFTDIAGYTKLMGEDEEKAVNMLSTNRSIHQSSIEKFNGTLIKEIGDGILASFSLASEAVRCAMDIQKACKDQNIPLKIGIHEGEMIFSGSDVIGDGVNIASRLQEEAQEGCIHISASVYRDIKNKADIQTKYLGEKSFKNVDEPVKVYTVFCGEEKLEDQPREDEMVKKPRNKLLYYILSGVVFVIIAIILLWKYIPSKPIIAEEKTIAVLPFENMSESEDYAYFGDVLTDEIIMQLQKIKDFKVRSNTSVLKYKESDKTSPEIGKELNVNYVIEGAAQRFQDNVRIRVQLIDARTDEHVWGDAYDREWGDIFKLQGEIAKEVATELKTILSANEIKEIEKKPTDNLEAYEFFLKGRDFHSRYWMKGDRSELANAIIFYRKALEIDPDFSLAIVLLGSARFAQTYWDDYFKENFGDSLLWYVEKALAIDPDLTEGLLWKGNYYFYRGDNLLAIKQYRKVLDIQPNFGRAYLGIGGCQIDEGEYLKGILNLKRADKLLIGDIKYNTFLRLYSRAFHSILDFDNAIRTSFKRMDYDVLQALQSLAWLYTTMGDTVKLKDITDDICAIDSNEICMDNLAYLSAIKGNYEKAWEHYQRYEEMMRDSISYGQGELHRKANILLKLNREKEANAILEKEIEYYLEGINLGRAYNAYHNYDLAGCYALLKEKEKVYDILHELEEGVFPGQIVSYIQVDPMFEGLWEDEEFRAIIRRLEKKYAEIRAEIDRLEKEGLL